MKAKVTPALCRRAAFSSVAPRGSKLSGRLSSGSSSTGTFAAASWPATIQPSPRSGQDQLELVILRQAQHGLDVARPVHGHDQRQLALDAPAAALPGRAATARTRADRPGRRPCGCWRSRGRRAGPRAGGAAPAAREPPPKLRRLASTAYMAAGERSRQSRSRCPEVDHRALARDQAVARLRRDHRPGQPFDAVRSG